MGTAGGLTPPPYALYRRIRRDPTIALVRASIIAAVVDIPWGLKVAANAPAGAEALVAAELARWRDDVVEWATATGIDFGWAAWEMVGEVFRRQWRFRKLKPLLHDTTTIVLDDVGDLLRLEQSQGNVWLPKPPVVLDARDVLLISWRVEGSNLYGEPLLINAREAFQSWADTERAAHRYDIKIAGSQIVVHFPRGQGLDADGKLVDNSTLAKAILAKLESAGTVAVEAESMADAMSGVIGENPAAGWKIEVLANPNATPQFGDRLNYLDKLKVRALGFPERAILEASTGTRADATVHASFAILNLERMGRHIARDITTQPVDRLLEENYGPDARGTVSVESGKLEDQYKNVLINLATEILKTPEGQARVDWDAVLADVGIPRTEGAAT